MKKLCLCVASAALLSACGTVPPNYNPVLPYDASASNITSFDASGMDMPERATGLDVPIDYGALSNNAMNQAMYATPGASPGAAAAGGLIGVLVVAAIDAGIDANRNSRIRDLLEEHDFEPREVFTEALTQALAARGYAVSFDTASTSSGAGNTGTLEIEIGHYGYQINAMAWTPNFISSVTVRDANGDILMRDNVMYGKPSMSAFYNPNIPVPPVRGDAVVVPYDPSYVFRNVDEFVQDDPERGVAGLRDALTRSAETIADLLGEPQMRSALAPSATHSETNQATGAR